MSPIRRPAAKRILILSVALAAAPGCPRPEPAPSVLLITLDTLRADHLGCYGSKRPLTPHLDALAAAGTRFDQAATTAPLTLPAHTSLLTSTWPETHGVRANADGRFGGGVPTLAEILHGAGYATAAVVAAFVLDRQFGLAVGFDDYDDRLGEAAILGESRVPGGEVERKAGEVTRRAAAWLEQHTARRFFLWVHYFDAHHPYEPPSPHAERHRDAPYAGEVEYVDAEIGRLLAHLDRLGLRQHTLVVVVGDHGEGLGDHGEETHGFLLYESTIRVPLILSLPGRVPSSRVVTAVVSTVDILPTVLDLAGIAPPPSAVGRSLLASARRAAGEGEAYAESSYGHLTFGFSRLKSLRKGDLKYIKSASPELYDLAQDPAETRNLIDSRSEAAVDLDRRLTALVEAALARGALAAARPAEAGGVSAEVREKLLALGYVSGRGSDAAGDELDFSGPSPATGLSVVEALERSLAVAAKGDPAGALVLLRAQAIAEPRNFAVRLHIGRIALQAGGAGEAERNLEEALVLAPTSIAALEGLLDLYRNTARPAPAVAISDRLLALHPGLAEVWIKRGVALGQLGRVEDTVASFEKALALAPDKGEPYLYLGEAEAQRGRTARALELYERAEAILGKSPKLSARLLELRRQAGQAR